MIAVLVIVMIISLFGMFNGWMMELRATTIYQQIAAYIMMGSAGVSFMVGLAALAICDRVEKLQAQIKLLQPPK